MSKKVMQLLLQRNQFRDFEAFSSQEMRINYGLVFQIEYVKKALKILEFINILHRNTLEENYFLKTLLIGMFIK